MDKVVKFFTALPEARAMRADAAALGIVPHAAVQYCEAMRTASGWGYYCFPTQDWRLRFDGQQTMFMDAMEHWHPLRTVYEESAAWTENAPEALRGSPPPLVSAMFVPGLVQIWTGLLASTLPDWSLLIRPPVNLPPGRAYQAYEAIVESDAYGPFPLFMNLQLHPGTDVVIDRYKPLLQAVPIWRESYQLQLDEPPVLDLDRMTAREWEGVGRALRVEQLGDRPGNYGAAVRRRAKKEEAA